MIKLEWLFKNRAGRRNDKSARWHETVQLPLVGKFSWISSKSDFLWTLFLVNSSGDFCPREVPFWVNFVKMFWVSSSGHYTFRLGTGRRWVSIGKRQPLDWPGPMNTTTSHAIALRRAEELASIVIEFSGLTYLPSSLALGQVMPRDSNDSSTCTILHYPLFLHSKPFYALLWMKGKKCIY